MDLTRAVVTESTVSLFAELRKFGLGAVWAAQTLAGFDDSTRNAILGNVGTLISFAVSGEDAEVISREFSTVIHARELVSLPSYHFFIKLRIDGTTSNPFSAETVPLSHVSDSNVFKRFLHFETSNPEKRSSADNTKDIETNTNVLF